MNEFADDDPEILAMAAVRKALHGLDAETTKRVLDWANKRFRPPTSTKEELAEQITLVGSAEDLTTDAKYVDFPALFDAADPKTGLERVLVTAYWFQHELGHEDFDSATINKELKHLGHPSGNITRDLDALIARTPRLVIQTRKLGSTKQARKQYKLTREGVRAVDQMLRGADRAD